MSAKRLTIRNISRNEALKSVHPVPIISISDRYGSDTAIHGENNGRRVLRIEFFAGDHWDDKEQCMSPEIAKEIHEFMQSLPEDTQELLVHCTEGRIRSYTVCLCLHREYDEVEVHEGSGHHDQWTYHVLRTELSKLTGRAEVRERRRAEIEAQRQEQNNAVV